MRVANGSAGLPSSETYTSVYVTCKQVLASLCTRSLLLALIEQRG